MSKTIKHRAWHIPTNRMFEVYSFGGDAVFENPNDGVHASPTLPADRKDCILMEFIGCKDWHAKEVYDGDIVVVSGRLTSFTGVVVWHNQTAGYYIKGAKSYREFIGCAQSWHDEDPDVIYLNNVEVIGNIHADPNLIPKR